MQFRIYIVQNFSTLRYKKCYMVFIKKKPNEKYTKSTKIYNRYIFTLKAEVLLGIV